MAYTLSIPIPASLAIPTSFASRLRYSFAKPDVCKRSPRQARKDTVSDVLMDAGLSRWLRARPSSNATERADVLPLRDDERALEKAAGGDGLHGGEHADQAV